MNENIRKTTIRDENGQWSIESEINGHKSKIVSSIDGIHIEAEKIILSQKGREGAITIID